MYSQGFIHSVFTDEELLKVRSQAILVAVSGGPDSVALLRLLLETGADCHVAHCNFHLRDEESMRDELFVRTLCKHLNVPLSVRDFDVKSYQQQHGGSVEMACRDLRYQWFEHEMSDQGCHLIAVAHHADDQIETFFLNLMRGTGARGLSGMERLNGHIWRPLLSVNRHDIIQYLSSIGQDYIIDSTNAQNTFRRNRLRNIIIPAIVQQFPQASERILDTMHNLSVDNALLASMVNQLIPDAYHIGINVLINHPHASALLYHRIRHWGFNRSQCLQAIMAIQHQHTGRQFIARNHRLVVNRNSLDIEEITGGTQVEIPINLHKDLETPIHLTITHNNPPFSPNMCDGRNKVAFNTRLLDCQHITMRHWRKGDRMKPFGLNGSKLISDLFADLKLSHNDKNNAWIIEADGNIIWVIGLRASALYPVTPLSRDYILLEKV